MLRPSFCCLLLLIVFPGLCLAHRVMLNAWIEDGELYAEMAFGNGSAASEAEVSVLAPESGNVLFSAMTDDEGIVEAVLPPEVSAKGGELLVAGNAGAGHRVEQMLAADEVTGPPGAPESLDSGTKTTNAMPARNSETVDAAKLSSDWGPPQKKTT